MKISELKHKANDALENANYDPKKLALLFMGAILLFSLVLSLLNSFIDSGIAGSGGLSGIGLRSALGTVSTVLSLAQSVISPIWTAGFTIVCLQLLRRQETNPRELLRGFPIWWPLFRLLILEGLIYFGLSTVGAYISSFVFMLTPWGGQMMTLFNSLTTTGLTQAHIDTLMPVILPYLLIVTAVLLILIIPIAYRLRLAQFFLLDEPHLGARIAMGKSRIAMKGNCRKLFLLDLSFWWFYLLLGLAVTVGVLGTVWEQTTGIALGRGIHILLSATAAVAQLLLMAHFLPKVNVTYAAFYEEAIPQELQSLPEQEFFHEAD